MERPKTPSGIALGLSLGLATAVLGSMTLGCETIGHNSSSNSNSVAAKGVGKWEPSHTKANAQQQPLSAGGNQNSRPSVGPNSGTTHPSATPVTGGAPTSDAMKTTPPAPAAAQQTPAAPAKAAPVPPASTPRQ